MQKFFVLVSVVFLTLALARCGNAETAADNGEIILAESASPETIDDVDVAESTEDENYTTAYLDIRIATATNELLNAFTYLHEFDYTIVLQARDGGRIGDFNGNMLAIWANKPLRNFSVMLLGNDSINDELFFIPIDFFGHVEELSPGHAFIINSYMALGTLPWSGIVFTDDSGARRYFTMIENAADDGEAWLIREFENRNDELPEDWQPWWEESGQEDYAPTNTWQETYAEILRFYADLPLQDGEVGWRFILHDIDQDRIPELFIAEPHISGHIGFRSVYTFAGGVAVPLEFENLPSDGALLAIMDINDLGISLHPWIIAFHAVGSGGFYEKLVAEKGNLVSIAEGWAMMSEEGHRMMYKDDAFEWWSYEWRDLTINGNEATVQEFEYMFGSPLKGRIHLELFEVNENNISRYILWQ